MSPGTRAASFDAVDRFIEREYMADGKLAGAQLAISHRGTRHEACFGYLDRERSRPMPADALFRIFSMTKPITCVAFMMLVEEGRINLQDPVSRYIPAWADLKLADGRAPRRPMRVSDLLSHTSGLTYGIQYRTELDARYRSVLSMRADGQSLKEFVNVLASLPLEFEPGTVWNYSVSTDVLGYLIEHISGQPFDEFLQQRVLGPLGMTDTGFFVPPEDRHRLAECYVRRADEPLSLPGRSFETVLARRPSFFSGGGGLISSVRDYMKFCAFILDDTPTQVPLLSRKTLKLMSINQLPEGRCLPEASLGLFSDAGYTGIGFGLGWPPRWTRIRRRCPETRATPFGAEWPTRFSGAIPPWN